MISCLRKLELIILPIHPPFALQPTQIQPYLSHTHTSSLLLQDTFGRTPFLAAVQQKQFGMGLALAQTAHDVTHSPQQLRTLLLANVTDPAAISPLHNMYSGNTCTFIFTGSNSITQHVFECNTCNLTDGLCVCVACAERCHSGHDIVDKGFSPHAYCDCREKGKCCMMPPTGPSRERRQLLELLSQWPAIVSLCDTLGRTALEALSVEVRLAPVLAWPLEKPRLVLVLPPPPPVFHL